MLPTGQPAGELGAALEEDRKQLEGLAAQLGVALAPAGDEARRQILLDGQALKYSPPLRAMPDAPSGDAIGRFAGDDLVSEADLPAMDIGKPLIVFSRVVLPAPFGPTTETTSPS